MLVASLHHTPCCFVIEQFQVRVGPIDLLSGGQFETFRITLINLGLGRELPGIFKALQQARPCQTMHRVGAQIGTQPRLSLGGRAARFMPVDQRIKLDIGEHALVHDVAQQRN